MNNESPAGTAAEEGVLATNRRTDETDEPDGTDGTAVGRVAEDCMLTMRYLGGPLMGRWELY